MKFSLVLIIASLFTHNLAHAEQIQALVRGEQSLSAFYQSIENAKQSIDLATYLLEPCDSSAKLLLNAMIKKAKAGVKVRLIVEEFSTKQPNRGGLPAYLASQSKNIELRYAGSSSFFVLDATRLHAKEFIVDGRTYLVGGRNISDEYFGLSSKLNYIDQDLIVTGASAREAQKQFDLLWTFTHAAPAGDANAFYANCFAPKARDKQVSELFRAESASILASSPVRSCRGVDYVVDYPDTQSCNDCTDDTSADYLKGERWRNKHATRQFLSFLQGTRDRIEIMNQYYMPWERVDAAFEALRSQKKTVALYSNTTGDIDLFDQNKAFTCYIQSAAVRTTVGTQKVRLLSTKGSMNDRNRLTPQGASWRIHGKSAVRDGRDVLVSSFNIDPRSYMTNIEASAVVENCPDLAADLAGQFVRVQDFTSKDRSCAGCASEILPANIVPGVNCGGAPTFY